MSAIRLSILGMFASFSLLACTSPSATMNPMQTPSPIHILFLGDSYTIGTGVAFSENWPTQILDILNSNGTSVEEYRIIAQNGWTTADLADAVERAELENSYDLVTMLIGVNNQFRGYSFDKYQLEFRELLEQAVAFAEGDPTKVIVISIPDWGATPFAAGRDREEISSQIDAFNAINQSEADAAGVHYVDVTAISRQAADDPMLLAPDELHPSPKMYAQWVDIIMPVAIQVLSGR